MKIRIWFLIFFNFIEKSYYRENKGDNISYDTNLDKG